VEAGSKKQSENVIQEEAKMPSNETNKKNNMRSMML
jgi:hypothetical protein